MKSESYSPVAKSFHWLVVLMVAVQFTVGWIMPEVRRTMAPAGLVSFHMSFGILILAVMLLRLLWRLTHAVPPAESRMPLWQEFAARCVHYLLYISLVILPLTGWALASARGWTVTLFGYYTMPQLVTPGSSTQGLFDFLHVASATGVAMLIGLHIVAALYHAAILRDGVLERMLPNVR